MSLELRFFVLGFTAGALAMFGLWVLALALALRGPKEEASR